MRLRYTSMGVGLAVGITAVVVAACAFAAFLYSRHHFDSLVETARAGALREGELIRVALILERLTGCERLLTAKELGAILSISPKTLYSYVTRGMIPHFKIESCVRFRGVEIAEWLRHRAA